MDAWRLGVVGEWLESKGILRRGAKKKLQRYAGCRAGAPWSICRRSSNRGRSNPCWQHGMAITVRCSTGARTRSPRTSRSRPVSGRRCRQAWAARAHGFAQSGRRDHPLRQGRPGRCGLSLSGSRQAGDAQYNRGGAARDSVIRVFYVGLTRARETLYICQRETGMAVTI